MTTDENRALLEALRDCHPYLVPERVLFKDVCNRLVTPLPSEAFRALLQACVEKRRVHRQSTEDGPKYKITDDGFARLAELP